MTLSAPPSPACRVEIGVILAVNTDAFSALVRTNSGRVFDHVPWASPVAHPDGSGIWAMPQASTRVVLVWPVGSDKPVILGWLLPVDEDGGYRQGRDKVNQGDIVLKTPDGAQVVLRHGGLLEVFSGPLNHWLYIPLHNVTRGVVENYELVTPGGKLLWNHDRESRTTTLKWLFRSLALHPRFQLLIEAGYIDDGSLLRILYDDPDAQGGEGGLCQLRVGDLGDGHVLDLNVDHQIDLSLGRDRQTGTLARLHLAGGDDESVSAELGRNTQTGALLSLTATDGPRSLQARFGRVDSFEGGPDVLQVLLSSAKLQLGVEEDGRTKLHLGDGALRLHLDADGRTSLDLADGTLRLVLSPDGAVTLEAAGDLAATVAGACHVTCDDIRLGSGSAAEQLVLGNSFLSFLNSLVSVYNGHVHVGNMGAPTSPPLQPQVSMQPALLSPKARTE